MKYAKSYRQLNMIEKQPQPESGFGAAIVGITFGMIGYLMWLGWCN
jgi:hypothetical protein